MSRVFIKTDEENRITACFGGVFEDYPHEGYFPIDEGEGERYFHCQTQYFSPELYTEDGICRWKYTDGACVLRSEAEIEAERESRPAPYDEREDMANALDMLGVSE